MTDLTEPRYSAMKNPPPRRPSATRILDQEDLNFLLTNRVPRALLTRFMGWFSKIEHPLVAALSIRIWRLFADLDLSRIITERLDAVLYGYQPMEVMWGKVGGYLVPVDVIGKPADWFVYDDDNQLRMRTRQSPLKGEEDRKSTRLNSSH